MPKPDKRPTSNRSNRSNSPNAPKSSHRPLAPQLWLRRRDQACVATLVVFGWLTLAGWWWAAGGGRGELRDFETTAKRDLTFQLDINQADWTELAMLPRVGPTLARRIVAWRTEHGRFRSLADLRRVRGIGPKTFEEIRPHLAPIDGRR